MKLNLTDNESLVFGHVGEVVLVYDSTYNHVWNKLVKNFNSWSATGPNRPMSEKTLKDDPQYSFLKDVPVVSFIKDMFMLWS